MINTVCFDLDATLVRSDKVILNTFDYIFKTYFSFDKPLEYYERYMGPPLYVTFSEYTNDKEKIDFLVQEFIRYYKEIELPLISLCPGVIETMEYLKKNNYNICLITTKFYTSSENSITHLGLKDYFTDFVCLERQIKHKPNPEPIYQVIEDLKVEKENIIMVGDNEVDIMCGKNANVKTALVMYNNWSKDTKEKVNPDYTLNSMTDLIKVLEENK